MADLRINRNSLNMLKSNAGSFITHNAIPGVSLGGANPFTIELFFYLGDDTRKTALYSQPGVFELGVDSGSIYYDAPGFCGFTLDPNTAKLCADNFYFVALTFDGAKLCVYIQGHKAMETNTGTAAPNKEEFLRMGAGELGYICTVRVFSEALDAVAILRDNINELQDAPSCAAWVVFWGQQPQDLSKNKLTLSRVGSEARIVNLVACTSFSGSGHAEHTNYIPSNASSLTILGKVFPTYCPQNAMVIANTRNSSGGITVLLRKSLDLSYRLALLTAAGEAVSSEVIDPNRWLDFAVVFSGNLLTLMVNGKVSSAVRLLHVDVRGGDTVTLGANSSTGSIDYGEGFCGYMDYISVFEGALDENRIHGYVDNPPHIFDKGIIMSLVLNRKKPMELVFGGSVIVRGDARFTLAEATNPLNAPKGVTYFIPTDKDPLWDTLSLEDKWALKYYCQFYDEVSKNVLGASGGAGDLAMSGTTALIRRRFHHRAFGMNTPSDEGTAQDTQRLLDSETIPERNSSSGSSKKGCGSGLGVGASAGAGAAAAAGGGSGLGTGIMLALMSGAITTIISILRVIFNRRPAPYNSQLTINSMWFNHDGDGSQGSLNCRADLDTPIAAEADVDPETGILDITGVFAADIINDIELVVSVSCRGDDFYGNILAHETGRLFGNLSLTNISIANGQTKEFSVTISPDIMIADANGMTSRFISSWQWTYETGGKSFFLLNSMQTAYLVPSSPLHPWESEPEAYDQDNIYYVWTSLLDICCEAVADYTAPAGTPPDIVHMQAYTYGLNANPSFMYDTEHGASFYTMNLVFFKPQKYVNDCASTAVNKLNCTDCANIVAIEALATGIDASTVIMTGIGNGFACTEIQAIGKSTWRVPFNGAFSYHQVTVMGKANPTKDSRIFDACLKLDGGDYPGKSYTASTKKPFVPVNIPFAETGKFYVSVPVDVPYKKDFYRERLVVNNAYCNLLAVPLIPSAFYVTISGNAAKFDTKGFLTGKPEVNGLDEYINMVRRRFDLPVPPKTPDGAAAAKSAGSAPDSAVDINGFELTEDYGSVRVYTSGLGDQARMFSIFAAPNETRADEILVSQLSMVTNPALARNDISEHSFGIADSLVIARKGKTVIQTQGPESAELARVLLAKL